MVPTAQKQRQRVSFSTTIDQITDLNPSFAIGKMRIAYVGDNVNGSSISKDVLQDAVPTMFNCPVVAHYDRAANSFGSHDFELVLKDNKLKLINITQPVGVVPNGAECYFETDIGPDGVEHEYLSTNVILWKRQEAYEHILEVGTVDESMECVFTDCHLDDRGYLVADKMYFEAFCLLETAEPCYQGASVEAFSEDQSLKFKQQYARMMAELMQYADADGSAEISQEGGKTMRLDNSVIDGILAEFSLSADKLDFEITDETTEEEIRAWAEQFAAEDGEAEEADDADEGAAAQDDDLPTAEDSEDATAEEGDPQPVECAANEDTAAQPQTFSATYGERMEALSAALPNEYDGAHEVYYWLVDFDDTYAYVHQTFYTADECIKRYGRLKYTISDDASSAAYGEFEEMVIKWLTLEENDALEQRRALLDELIAYRAENEKKTYQDKLRDLFAEFKDLEQTEEFAQYVEQVNALAGNEETRLTLDEVREHCFCLRGKRVSTFSEKLSSNTVQRVPVAPPKASNSQDDGVGELFDRFG